MLPAVIDKDSDGTGAYRSTRTLTLRRATNGVLIGEEKSSGVGVMFWGIPLASSQTFWYQWEVKK